MTKSALRAWTEPLEPRVLLSGTTLSTTAWTPIGPAPIANSQVPGNGPVSGRINGIAADPSDPNTLYIAAAGGGVWKTTNAGGSWTPLTDSQSTLYMGSVAVAPSSPDVIYAGTGEADQSGYSFYGRGVLKSADGGSTWALMGNSVFNRLAINHIVVDPTNANTVYADVFGGSTNGVGGNTGIWKSTDGGNTWTNTTASINSSIPYTDLQIDPSNPQHLLCAVGSFATSLGGAYQTTNGGASWSLITALPNGAGLGNIQLALAPSNPQVMYVSVADPNTEALVGMWTSTDGGTTWSQLPNLPNYLTDQAWLDSTLIVNPQNPQIVYAGGQTLVQSTDGGQHWNDISTGANGAGTEVNHHAFAFDAAGHLLDGNSGGIWRLDNASPASIAWTDLNSNLQITQFYSLALNPSDPNAAFGGTQHNGSVQYSGSTAWTQRQIGNQAMVQYDPQNPTRIYQLSPDATAFFDRSDDGGVTWTPKISGINPADPRFYPAPYWVDPNNGNHLLFGTDHIYESFDGGDSWTPISAPNTNGWNANGTISNLVMSPADPNTIYATASGLIFSTHDHGATWQQSVGINGPFARLVPDPSNPQVCYVARRSFGGSHVARTSEGGVDWQDLSGNLPNIPTFSIALDPAIPGQIFAGTDTGVYVTNNDGVTWAPFAAGLPNVQVHDLQFDPAHNLLAAASYGRGVWEISTAPAAPLVVNTLVDETNSNDGMLSLREAAAAQTSGQAITFDPSLAGGTIALDPANGPLTLTGPVTINGLTSGTITITGAAGAPLEAGAGSVVRLSNLTLGGLATALQIDSGGQVLLQNVNVSAPTTDNGSLTALQFADGSFTGPITGAGSLTKSGPATLTLTAPNAYTGGTTVRAGVMSGNSAALQGNITVVGGAIVAFDQSTLPSGSGNSFYGNISGGGMVHLLGPNSIVHLGTNASQVSSKLTNTGTTTIDSGADLIPTAANQFASGSDYAVNGILDLGGFSQAIGALLGSGTVYNLAATPGLLATLTTGADNHSTTFSGLIEDSPAGANGGVLALTKAGYGNLNLRSASGTPDSYSGGTTISGGFLIGNTLTIHGSIITQNTFLTIDETLDGLGSGTLNANVSGNGGLFLYGTVRLSPTASLSLYSDSMINGTLITGAPNDLGTIGHYVINGVLDLGGFDQSIQSFSGAGTIYNNDPTGQNRTSTLTIATVYSSTFSGLLEDHPAGGSGVLALRSNYGPMLLTGSNTFSGGITLDNTGTSGPPAGSLTVGPSAGNPLGTGPITLAGFQPAINLLGRTTGPVQAPISVSGFNQDVVVEASANNPAAATTTEFDNLDVGGNNVWYEEGFGGAAAAGTGLPANGVIVSAINPAVTFQLQPYTGPNAAFVAGNNGSATLSLNSPGHFSSLNFLGSAADGPSGGILTLNFADGSTTQNYWNFNDWFNYPNAAFIAGGRVLRSPGAAVSLVPGNARMYEVDITLNQTDQLKTLQSITFTQQHGNSFAVFAVSGTSFQFLPGQSYPNSFALSNGATINVEASATVQLGGLAQTDNTTSTITGIPGTSVTAGSDALNVDPTQGPGWQLPTGIKLTIGALTGGTISLGGQGTLYLTGPNTNNGFGISGGTMVFENGSAVPNNTSFLGVAGTFQFAPSNSPFTAMVSGLNLGGTSTLDLTDNSLDVVWQSYPDLTATVRSYIQNGRISSSLADANHTLGSSQQIGSILVELANPGDVNLDGTVNLADFLTIARNFGLPYASWTLGDLNYDGTVNLADLLILVRHFGQHYTIPAYAPSMPAVALSPATASAQTRRRRSVI